jgi:hypothetical protein
VEETGGYVGDLVDGCVEGCFVGFRGFVEAADLPDELQRGVANLCVGHGWIEVEEVFDVSAHGEIIGRVRVEFTARAKGYSGKMRGSLHSAADDETVCCSGRDDAFWGELLKDDEAAPSPLWSFRICRGSRFEDVFVEDHGVEALADEET